jgi:hypothetical protein
VQHAPLHSRSGEGATSAGRGGAACTLSRRLVVAGRRLVARAAAALK